MIKKWKKAFIKIVKTKSQEGLIQFQKERAITKITFRLEKKKKLIRPYIISQFQNFDNNTLE